jgi:hypothetical protein
MQYLDKSASARRTYKYGFGVGNPPFCPKWWRVGKGRFFG